MERLAALSQSQENVSVSSSPPRRKVRKESSAGKVAQLTVEYYYTPAAELRTRRQAASCAAQRLPRRVLVHTCRHTTDLDIENCMFTLLHQVVKSVKVSPVIPLEVLDTLDQCANNRDGLAAEILRTSLGECKAMLTAVFNGGATIKQMERQRIRQQGTHVG